jgi:hypothetical protein
MEFSTICNTGVLFCKYKSSRINTALKTAVFSIVMWIRKHFFSDPGSYIPEFADPEGRLITDPAGSGSYLDIFVDGIIKFYKK